MNQLGGFPLLTLIVFLPIIGGLISLLVPPDRRETFHWLAFLITVTDLFIALFLYMGWVNDPEGSAQFVDGPWPWIASLGIHYHLGIDGISLHLLLLTTLLTPLTILVAWSRDNQALENGDPLQGTRARTFLVLLFEAATLGALTALDLALFYTFWLMALLTTFFLANEDARHSQIAMRFIIAVAIAAVAMLGALVWLSTSQSSLDLPDLLAAVLPRQAQAWLFWGMTLAFGITGGVFPLHRGHAEAYGQASPTVRVLISSLPLNIGVYGLIRFCLPLFPLATASFAPAMVILGTVGLIYGAIAMLGQKRFPHTLAYWNISQMGLTTIGIFSLQNLGLHGAVMHAVSRSLSSAALLLMLDMRSGQKNSDSDRPFLPQSDRSAVAVGFLSAIGVPGLVGFVGQGTSILGILRWHWRVSESAVANRVWDWVLYAAVASSVLIGMWALLRAWQRVPFSPVESKLSRQAAIALPVLFLIVFAGLYPSICTDTIGPSVYRLLGEVNRGIERDLLFWANQ